MGKSSASPSQPPTGRVSTPRKARWTRPSVIKSLAMLFAVLMGMAKTMPAVVSLVGADKFRRVLVLVTEHDFDRLRFLDDVKIGEDVTARIDDKSGARPFDGHGVHEKVVFGGFGEDVRDGGGSLAVDANVDGFVSGESGVALGVRCGAARQGFHPAWLPRAVPSAGPVSAQNEHQRGEKNACAMGGVGCSHRCRPFLIHSIDLV